MRSDTSRRQFFEIHPGKCEGRLGRRIDHAQAAERFQRGFAFQIGVESVCTRRCGSRMGRGVAAFRFFGRHSISKTAP